MSLAVDLVLATRPNASTGIERYAVNLFKALRQIDKGSVAFVDKESSFASLEGAVPVQGGMTGWLKLPLSQELRRAQSSALLCPAFPPSPLTRFTSMPVIRIIHDDFPWHRARAMSAKGRLMFRDLETWLAPSYKHIFAPVAQMATSLSSILKRDVSAIGNAPGVVLSDAPPANRQTTQLIAVGTIEPRKNYETLLALMEELDVGWSMTIVGRAGWGDIAKTWQEAVNHTEGRVRWFGDASDKELISLYQASGCFISMSHAEGFNMPLVEAGSLGLPIVCSDLPIHRDVAPPWARFVSLSQSVANITHVIYDAVAYPPEESAVERYRKRFSWTNVAENLRRSI